MSLNSTVLNWPNNIAPIFDQNDEVNFNVLAVNIQELTLCKNCHVCKDVMYLWQWSRKWQKQVGWGTNRKSPQITQRTGLALPFSSSRPSAFSVLLVRKWCAFGMRNLLYRHFMVFLSTCKLCIVFICRLWLLLRRAMKVHSWRKERKLCWSLTSSRGMIRILVIYVVTHEYFIELCSPKIVPFYLYTFNKWFVLTKTCVKYKTYSSSDIGLFSNVQWENNKIGQLNLWVFVKIGVSLAEIIKCAWRWRKTNNIDGLLIF